MGKALYSVPWRFIGRQVDARCGERTVEVFSDGVVIKTWARIERGRQTDWADYPPHKVAFFMRTSTWMSGPTLGFDHLGRAVGGTGAVMVWTLPLFPSRKFRFACARPSRSR